MAKWTICYPNGNVLKFKDIGSSDVTHCEIGPAIKYPSGFKVWCFEGKKHRLDGPAVEFSWGEKEWWIDGEYLDCKTQEEFERLMKMRAFW